MNINTWSFLGIFFFSIGVPSSFSGTSKATGGGYLFVGSEAATVPDPFATGAIAVSLPLITWPDAT